MKHLAFIILFIIIFLKCYSQMNLKPRTSDKCPMIIPNSIGKELVSEFIDQINRLHLRIKISDSIMPTNKKIFRDMVKDLKNKKSNGVRIYLAVTGNEGADSVPKGYGDSLIMIYAGTKNNKDIGIYYFILPDGTNFKLLPFKIANNWVNNFQDTILAKLNFGLSQGDTNTKSYLFSNYNIQNKQVFSNLVNEIDFQHKNTQVSGIRPYFGCFTSNNSKPDLLHRILIGFAFTDSAKNDIYIDTLQTEYGCKVSSQFPKFTGAINADTGTPCPPNSCNGTTLGH